MEPYIAVTLMWIFGTHVLPNPDVPGPPIGYVIELSNNLCEWEHVLTIFDPDADELPISGRDAENAVGHEVEHPFFSVRAIYGGSIPSGPRYVVIVDREHVWGADLDKDGGVGALDFNLLARCFVGLLSTDDTACRLADYNQNGGVDGLEIVTFRTLYKDALGL